MRKILGLFHFSSSFIRFIGNPNRLDLVFKLVDNLDPDAPAAKVLFSRPDVAPFLAQPGAPLRFDLPTLRAMPEGSLGRHFAAFLDQRGLDPAGLYHSGDEATTDHDRFKLHMERSHDLWHTVLGFDTDVAGELGLQALTMAQLGSPLGYMLLSAAMLNTLFKAPEDGDRRMEAITRGWQLGRRLRPLFGADWAGMITWPIEQVREHFGVGAADVRIAAMAA
jgi:ubiquinone biosynthesis protein COQ4